MVFGLSTSFPLSLVARGPGRRRHGQRADPRHARAAPHPAGAARPGERARVGLHPRLERARRVRVRRRGGVLGAVQPRSCWAASRRSGGDDLVPLVPVAPRRSTGSRTSPCPAAARFGRPTAASSRHRSSCTSRTAALRRDRILDSGVVGPVLSWDDVLHEGPVAGHRAGSVPGRARRPISRRAGGRPGPRRWPASRHATRRSSRRSAAARRSSLWFEDDLYDVLQLMQVLAAARPARRDDAPGRWCRSAACRSAASPNARSTSWPTPTGARHADPAPVRTRRACGRRSRPATTPGWTRSAAPRRRSRWCRRRCAGCWRSCPTPTTG